MTPSGRINKPWWQKAHLDLGTFLDNLKKEGVNCRLVGGVVRDTLLNPDLSDQNCDVDLAVDVSPDKLIAICLKLNIQVIPSGIDFGTITCLLNGKAYEFTSLRKDVKTDGRKAVVAFTQSWEEDAQRRDFTINALYADWNGVYYDFTGQGIQDLESKHVCFIGSPTQRIQEDNLRILRFFRFIGLFDKPTFCKHSYAACVKESDKLQTLSKERKWNELVRVYKSNYPMLVFEHLIKSKVISRFCDLEWSLSKLFNTLTWKQTEYSDVFFQLLGSINSFAFNQEVCIPSSMQKRLEKVFSVLISNRSVVWKEVYIAGKELYKEAYIHKYISSQQMSEKAVKALEQICLKIDNWSMPKFPVNGFDLQELGFEKGPIIGELLQATELWWVQKSFEPNYSQCLEHIRMLHLNKLKDTI